MGCRSYWAAISASGRAAGMARRSTRQEGKSGQIRDLRCMAVAVTVGGVSRVRAATYRISVNRRWRGGCVAAIDMARHIRPIKLTGSRHFDMALSYPVVLIDFPANGNNSPSGGCNGNLLKWLEFGYGTASPTISHIVTARRDCIRVQDVVQWGHGHTPYGFAQGVIKPQR